MFIRVFFSLQVHQLDSVHPVFAAHAQTRVCVCVLVGVRAGGRATYSLLEAQPQQQEKKLN